MAIIPTAIKRTLDIPSLIFLVSMSPKSPGFFWSFLPPKLSFDTSSVDVFPVEIFLVLSLSFSSLSTFLSLLTLTGVGSCEIFFIFSFLVLPPSFSSLSTFLSLPTLTGVDSCGISFTFSFLDSTLESFSFFFKILSIVSCWSKSFWVSFLTSVILLLISRICLSNSPICIAAPVAVLDSPFLERASAILSKDSDKLLRPTIKSLSIK